MPVCSLHLLVLGPSTDSTRSASFLASLASSPSKPKIILAGTPRRWIIRPTHTSLSLLSPSHSHPASSDVKWDLALVLEGDRGLPNDPLLREHVQEEFTLRVGIPSRLVEGFAKQNAEIRARVSPPSADVHGPSQAQAKQGDSQNLELDDALRAWCDSFDALHSDLGPPTMLNLLAFRPGMKDRYLQYGKAFAKTVGSRHGGDAKLVGTVIGGSDAGRPGEGWDEVAFAHYPSTRHFAAMLGDADYQAANKEHRLPALRDTLILCLTELELPLSGASARL